MSAANLRKRRGVVKALLTQLDTRLKYLEEAADRSSTRDPARSKLKEYDAELKAAHLSLIDLINDDDTLEREQANLDVHEDLIVAHAIRIAASEESSATATKVDERKVLSCRLNRLLGRLSIAEKAISSLSSEHRDSCQRKQHDEQLCDYKRDLRFESQTDVVGS